MTTHTYEVIIRDVVTGDLVTTRTMATTQKVAREEMGRACNLTHYVVSSRLVPIANPWA